MKEFIKANREKIQFIFKAMSIVFTIAWTIYLTKKYFDGVTTDTTTIIISYCIVTLIFPLFIQIALTTGEFIEFARINKILNNNPFDHLLTIGLIKSYTDKKNKWTSSKPTLTGTFDNYPIRCEVENGIVRIIANANLDQIGKADMKNWKKIFGPKNIEFDWFGVALVYRAKRYKQLTYLDIESELRQFIKMLREAKIDAWDIDSYT